MLGVLDVSLFPVEIGMHPGIVFAIATLDRSMGCIPVTISVMPQSFESAAEPRGGLSVLETGATGLYLACGDVHRK